MTGILNKFHVEHGLQGARVMARSHQLTPGCTSDAEIDAHIQMRGLAIRQRRRPEILGGRRLLKRCRP
jgi:hypothetical protein